MASVLLQNFGEMLMTFPALKMSHFPCMFYSINSCLKWYNSIYIHRTNMKLFILSHTLVLIKKIKGNEETSLVYFCYQSSNINCQKGNSYCEIAHIQRFCFFCRLVYTSTPYLTKNCYLYIITRPKKKNCYVALTRPKFKNWVGRIFFFFFTYRERVEFSNIFF